MTSKGTPVAADADDIGSVLIRPCGDETTNRHRLVLVQYLEDPGNRLKIGARSPAFVDELVGVAVFQAGQTEEHGLGSTVDVDKPDETLLLRGRNAVRKLAKFRSLDPDLIVKLKYVVEGGIVGQERHDLQSPILVQCLLEGLLQGGTGLGIIDIDTAVALLVYILFHTVHGDIVVETAVQGPIAIVVRGALLPVVFMVVQDPVEIGVFTEKHLLGSAPKE